MKKHLQCEFFLMKIQPKEWEKIFTNLISHKQLISKICKELIQHYTRKKKKKNTQKPNSKIGKGPE